MLNRACPCSTSFMSVQLRKYILVLGILLILFEKVIGFPYEIQVKILFVILFFFGIPHGALDFFVDQRSPVSIVSNNGLKFLGRYLFNMVAYALVWFLAPELAICIFILLTAYHFGEIDWMADKESSYSKMVYFILGLQWILFLLSTHMNEALDIVVLLWKGAYLKTDLLAWAAIVQKSTFFLMLISQALLFIYRAVFFSKSRYFWYSFLQWGILILTVVNLPLWICFAFYFGIWHSVLSFEIIRIKLSLSNDRKGWLQLFQKALPYSVAAWSGLSILVYIYSDPQHISTVFHFLFIGIAILTLPHLLVFTKIKIGHKFS